MKTKNSKKHIIIVSSILLALALVITPISMLSFASANETPGSYYGDVNGDGYVKADDARLALRAAVRLDTLNDAKTKRADIDKDGKVTAGDARLILRTAIKLEELIPFEKEEEPVIDPETTTAEEPTEKEETTTAKQETTTKKEEPVTQKPTEPTTHKTEPTTHKQETTTHKAEPTTHKQEPTTQKQEPTTQKQEPTTEKPTEPPTTRISEDEEAKLKAEEEAKKKDLENEGGKQEEARKPSEEPVSKGDDIHKCSVCGKNCADAANGDNACAYGGCTRYVNDIVCPHCDQTVKAWTCHTCVKPIHFNIYSGSGK